MRYHRTFPVLSVARVEVLRDLARVEYLTSIRLEPIVRQRKPLAMIELRFADQERAAVVPLVIVDVAMLLDPERDALVWPASLAGAIDERRVEELTGTIVPWTIAQALGRSLNDERIWHREDADERALFERVRTRGAIGAAPARVSFAAAMPFVYARRFWNGRRLGVAGEHAVLGVALAQAGGMDVAIATDETRDLDFERWYGTATASRAERRTLVVQPAARLSRFAAGVDPEAITVLIRSDVDGAIPLAAPAPLDAAFAFDSSTGSVIGSLDIVGTLPTTFAARRTHVGAAKLGTSSGRIYFGVRRAQDPGSDSDIDEARALAAALRDEGFHVDIGDDPAEIAAGGYDLVHVHGLLDASRALAFFSAAKRVGAATALHAHSEEATIGGWWGTVVTRYCYEYAADQRSIDDFIGLLRTRRIALGDVRADAAYAPADQDAAHLRAAIRAADVVFVSGEEEAAHLKTAYGRNDVVIVPPAVPTASAGAPVGAAIGTQNYALLHAPIGPRGNQIVAMQAAERANIPLVVAGSVEDPSYLALLREFAGGMTRILIDPSAAELETVYGGATVFLDVAWVGCGRARAARAAVAGARLVISDRRPVDAVVCGSDVTRVDPGDEVGIMRALGDAWYAATESRFEPALCERVASATVPRRVAAAVAAGYALATQSPSGPPARV